MSRRTSGTDPSYYPDIDRLNPRYGGASAAAPSPYVSSLPASRRTSGTDPSYYPDIDRLNPGFSSTNAGTAAAQELGVAESGRALYRAAMTGNSLGTYSHRHAKVSDYDVSSSPYSSGGYGSSAGAYGSSSSTTRARSRASDLLNRSSNVVRCSSPAAPILPSVRY